MMYQESFIHWNLPLWWGTQEVNSFHIDWTGRSRWISVWRLQSRNSSTTEGGVVNRKPQRGFCLKHWLWSGCYLGSEPNSSSFIEKSSIWGHDLIFHRALCKWSHVSVYLESLEREWCSLFFTFSYWKWQVTLLFEHQTAHDFKRIFCVWWHVGTKCPHSEKVENKTCSRLEARSTDSSLYWLSQPRPQFNPNAKSLCCLIEGWNTKVMGWGLTGHWNPY